MEPGNDPARLVARLRSLLIKGATTVAAAKAIGRSKTSTHELAARHGLERRRRAMDQAKRRRIQAGIRAAKLSVSELARKYEVAKSTVSDWRKRYLEKGLDARPKLKQPRRCPNGHLVECWPCLSCFPAGAITTGGKPND